MGTGRKIPFLTPRGTTPPQCSYKYKSALIRRTLRFHYNPIWVQNGFKMPKVYPKRTVFCCFAFDERAVMLLGYSIALAFFACAFLWQSSMQLIVPLALGHDKSLVSASCDVQTAQVVCLDSWESECHAMIDVRC